jgi:hypothetical protein
MTRASLFRAPWLALALALALLVLAPARAQSQLKLYPIKALFLPPPGPGRELIHAEFVRGVEPQAAGGYFEQEFRKRFPGAVHDVLEKDRRSTLVASLQISRASHYSVNKVDGTSDVYLPVSGSLYFTNVVSGEVLYTVSATYYQRATVRGSGEALEPARLHAMFNQAYQGLVEQLLAKAGEQFKPRAISAAVRRSWNGLYILDRGLEQGLARGDTLSDAEGNTLEVLHSGAAYAAATLSLGQVRPGASFTRETNLSAAEISKPRVLVLVDQAPPGMGREVLGQMFSDVLGAQAPVSVVPVNEMFSQVLATVFSKTALSSDYGQKRELPDFFVRLSVPVAQAFELPTTLRHKTVRSYRSIAVAELVDRSGRVLFAASGEDRIDDEVVNGMGFDRISRREVSVRNALLNLAENMRNELKFQRTSLPVLGPDRIQDERGLLAPGEGLTVLRNIGTVEGIAGPVLAPFLGVNVDVAADGYATVLPDLPLAQPALAMAAGDLVQLEVSATPRAVTRKRFGACGRVEQLGAVQLPAFGDLALNAVQRGLRAPFYSSGWMGRVQELVGPASRFKSTLKLAETVPDLCIEPVYRVDIAGSQCGGEPRSCTDSATVRVTLRVKKGDTAIVKSGLETKLSTSGYLEQAAPQEHQNSVATDLLAEAGKLAREIASKLNNEKFN